jgi:hypothetical protein
MATDSITAHTSDDALLVRVVEELAPTRAPLELVMQPTSVLHLTGLIQLAIIHLCKYVNYELTN